jgi:hypothetical protein
MRKKSNSRPHGHGDWHTSELHDCAYIPNFDTKVKITNYTLWFLFLDIMNMINNQIATEP